MSLQFCFLASGSGGNCTVIRTPAGVMLIDAGIAPRTAAKRMAGTGVCLADISAVCLTHLDRDHFDLSWVPMLAERGVPIFCHRSCLGDLSALAGDAGIGAIVRPFGEAPFEPVAGLRVEGFDLAHDAEGSQGFVLEGFGSRAGFATDLGHVPGHLFERFDRLNLLALESNYDPAMQVASGRPIFLKQRIMGGRGHLSNEQAFAAVKAILDRCEKRRTRLPEHIVLLHRSRQCNCPKLVRQLFSQDQRIAGRLTLAEQFQRSEWLGTGAVGVGDGEQLLLSQLFPAWG